MVVWRFGGRGDTPHPHAVRPQSILYPVGLANRIIGHVC